MSQPHEYQPTGGTIAVQAKTLFYNEGNPVAALVTKRGNGHKASMMDFKTAESALAWCRKNAAMLVYMPVNLTHG